MAAFPRNSNSFNFFPFHRSSCFLRFDTALSESFVIFPMITDPTVIYGLLPNYTALFKLVTTERWHMRLEFENTTPSSNLLFVFESNRT